MGCTFSGPFSLQLVEPLRQSLSSHKPYLIPSKNVHLKKNGALFSFSGAVFGLSQ